MPAKLTLEEMQKIAASRGGECLSPVYGNHQTKLNWRCAEGHEWAATPSHIRRGSWCRVCFLNSRKDTLPEMQRLAAARGGKCLSTEYVNSLKRLEWECEKGHRWWAKPGAIKNQKSWCAICANRVSLGIDMMKDLATERGGECLSEEYEGSHKNLLWRCSEGHEWWATPSNVKNNETWCLVCAGSAPLTIEDMHELAEELGGRCLSDTYINSGTPLQWECSEGHRWKARSNDIRQGKSWCPQCSGKAQLSIEEFQRLAEDRGGRCLSEEYVNNRTLLLFECAEGHQWEAAPSNFKHADTWCPFCVGKNKTIEDMHALAATKGGQCLSSEFTTAQSKLKWRCALGHEWEAQPTSVGQGSWCPVCSNSVSERVCRVYFEAIFGQSFPTKRPKWLSNDRGNRMELDGFCADLNLAFEYQGIQHFKSGNRFHRNDDQLEQRIQDDLRKADLCSQNGVILIDVPYTVGHGEMQEYIAQRCVESGLELPEGWETAEADLLAAYSPDKTAEMNEIARSRGGRLISDHYVGGHANLEWECARGHRWMAHPSHIKRGSWCAKCYHQDRSKTTTQSAPRQGDS